MQRELDPKLVYGILGVILLFVAGFMFMRLRTPADFSGPPVKFKPPRGFAIPTVGNPGQGGMGAGGPKPPGGQKGAPGVNYQGPTSPPGR